MQVSSKTIGKAAEDLVFSYLQLQGLKPVVANYQCRYGEIDLIMQDGETLVFVEVRHRRSQDYGDGVATVGKAKQDKIIRAATHYLQKNSLYDKVLCRFDVVATSVGVNNEIEWIKDAFWVKW